MAKVENLARRGFLGLLAGLVASPIIKPARTFVSFFSAPEAVTLLPEEKIMQALARLGPGGGTIFLQDGAKICGESILLPEDVTIRGNGILVFGCVVKSATGRNTPMFEVGEESQNYFSNCLFDAKANGPNGCSIRAGSLTFG